MILYFLFFPNLPKVLIADTPAPRPKTNSASSNGRPINNVKIRKTNKKLPPPLAAVIYGNFHTAPSPIAEPADARMKPIFEPHVEFSDIKFFLLKNS